MQIKQKAETPFVSWQAYKSCCDVRSVPRKKVVSYKGDFYIGMLCLGAICGASFVKGFQPSLYQANGGVANFVNHGYTKGSGLGAEIIGTFIRVYTVFSASDAKRSARDSRVPILAPVPIGFVIFLFHLAIIPITGTGINPARSLGASIIHNKDHARDDHLLNWEGTGAVIAKRHISEIDEAMKAHDYRLGSNCYRVAIEEVLIDKA